MKKCFLLLLLPVFLQGQTIPANRTVDWTQAGYPDSFPSPIMVLDVTAFGAIGDSVTDNAIYLVAAIDSLHGKRGVISFPSGNFIIGSSVDLPDSVIIRGTSSDSTHLIFNLNGTIGNGFNITGSASGNFSLVLDGASRGSSAVVVADATSFSTGDYAEIMEDNGSWDTNPVFWADNSVGQIIRVSSVSGDTLFLNSALRIDYDTSRHVRIQKISPAVETGIECLKISRADSVPAGVCFNIYYNYAANCWVKGIESSRSIGSHIEADASTNITITGSYIHDSFEYDGVSTHGYGITLFNHTGQCLVTNNILKHLRHSFSLQTGANGNVISYNYSLDPNRSEAPSNAGADISMHGHYPYANLFEGNIVQNIQLDVTWGKSGPFNTFFRNRAELYGIVMSSGSGQTDSVNFVGNEVTNMTIPFGNYILAGSGHFQHGNNIKGTVTPTGTNTLTDSSYYLTTPPSFWNSSPFPSIGIPNSLGSGSNPAKERYLASGSKTVCEESIVNSIAQPVSTNIRVFPNPATTHFNISGISGLGKTHVVLFDINGKMIFEKRIDTNMNTVRVELPGDVKSGFYILKIINSINTVVTRLLVPDR